MDTISKQIEMLDKNFIEKRNEFYMELNPPLSIEEIDQLETQYSVKIPNEIKLLYAWKNGQGASCESFFNGFSFMTLENALQISQMMKETVEGAPDLKNWWLKSWIPLFEDNGDYICYDVSSDETESPSNLIEFIHEDFDKNIIAPDLFSVIKTINETLESKEDDDYDRDFEINEIEGYPKYYFVD